MGIRDDVQAALAEALDSDLSDIVVDFDFIIDGERVYDEASDNYTYTPNTSPSRGVFSSYPTDKVDGVNVKATDEQVIINGSDCTIDPQIDQEIVANNIEYKIINAKKVMGGGSTPIIFELQVRKNG